MDDSTPIIDVTAHPSDYIPHDDFWAFLRRRKGMIGFFWMVAFLAAMGWLLTRPSVFDAESRIMVLRTGSGGPVSEAELASELELVRSPNHLDKTAAKLAAAPTDREIQELRRKLEAALRAEPAGKSNLVSVQVRDADPAFAARAVNNIVELYLADRRYIFQTGGRAPADPDSPATDALLAFDSVNHGPRLRTELDTRVQARVSLEARGDQGADQGSSGSGNGVAAEAVESTGPRACANPDTHLWQPGNQAGRRYRDSEPPEAGSRVRSVET
jgi:hypothetical protein